MERVGPPHRELPSLALSLMMLLGLPGCANERTVAPSPVERRFPAALPDGFTRIDLGLQPLVDGWTTELAFEATELDRSFVIVAAAASDSFVVISDLIAPDGTVYVTSEGEGTPAQHAYFAGFEAEGMSANRTVPRPGTAVAAVPNSDTLGMQPGRWRFRVRAVSLAFSLETERYVHTGRAGTVRVAVVSRQREDLERGRVHVDFVIPPGLYLSDEPGGEPVELTPETAPQFDAVRRVLSQLERSLATARVSLGEVRYLPSDSFLPPGGDPLGQREVVDLDGPACLGGPSLLGALHTGPGTDGPRVRIRFVQAFRCVVGTANVGSGFGGVSNGIPGVPGATHDGILVAVGNGADHRSSWVRVVAHEVGHFLGLMHTCELEAVEVCDALADTGEEHPTDNLMYPNAGLAGEGFSEAQGRILRASAYVVPE